MEDNLIQGLFFAGGYGVLITYAFLYITGSGAKLACVFTPQLWKIWVFSMLITTASVLGIYSHFSFKQRMRSWKRDLFIVSTCVFLGSAMLWSLSAEYITRKNLSADLERLPLTLTALATIGILVSVASSTDDWLLITAASIVVMHHLFFDAVIWANLHQKSKIIHI
jgi:hypothetical protein